MSVSPKQTSGSSSSWWGFHELAFIPHFKRSDLQIASFLSIFEVFSFFAPLSFFFLSGLGVFRSVQSKIPHAFYFALFLLD